MGKREKFLYRGVTIAFLLLCKPVNNYERQQRIVLTNSNDICPSVDTTVHTQASKYFVIPDSSTAYSMLLIVKDYNIFMYVTVFPKYEVEMFGQSFLL